MLSLLLLSPSLAPIPQFVPKVGMVVRASGVVRPGRYRLDNAEGSMKAGDETIPTFKPALKIVGDGITVDFKGSVLLGSDPKITPDSRRGLAILVTGKNVTLKNVRAQGFRVAIMGSGADGLRVLDSDLSYNYRQRLYSTAEREDERDWMSYHHNENNEWLRYGAAIYLQKCSKFLVRNVKVTGGQNGLLMTQSNRGTVVGCNFSYNSALGLGMYRSSDNRILLNQLDFNVRGFSYGVYNRGQDSAGILAFEQCNRNLFASNSVTHGGDGFFLWAGQTTMDTGKGGSNDNELIQNDFSHAVTNGIEVTFSRNKIIGNRIYGCAHGIWGGYSYNTEIRANRFADNQAAVAIEHGQQNQITVNKFLRDDVAISLWSNAKQDPEWVYPKKRDTRSQDNTIELNLFESVGLALDHKRTAGTTFSINSFVDVGEKIREGEASTFKVKSLSEGPDPTPLLNTMVQQSSQALAPTAKAVRFLKDSDPQGWSRIYVDEWGPYDYQRPLLAPHRFPLMGEAPKPGANSAAGSGRKSKVPAPPANMNLYDVLGPKGNYRIVTAQGLRVTKSDGKVPGSLEVDPIEGYVGTVKLDLEYVGQTVTDAKGLITKAGAPYRFGFERFVAPIDWNVKFYAWEVSQGAEDPHSPPEPTALKAILDGPALHEMKTPQLNFGASGAFYPDGPKNKFATISEGTVTLPDGNYTLTMTADDGIRVWVDGKQILDEWHYEGPTTYTRRMRLSGLHKIRIEHFEIDGYAALQFSIKP